ncbi:MAG: hypothetical protein IPN67_04730 [Bacteroidales bacterium]|nr:hypothetical protein [Bacteroidales bacterium]
MSPDENWIRVYDHSDLNRLFYSLDVTELTDKSFVILGSTKMDTTVWPTPYILYTSNEGIITRSVQIEDFISPVPDIIASDGGLYFFCMDNALGTHVLKINTDGSAPTPVKSFPELTYPLSASVVTGNRILLTSYNRINKSTVLTCFDANFSIIWSNEYSTIENYEEKVRLHLTRQGQYFPFFTGEVKQNNSDFYFVNGFYNFVFSLLFINSANGTMTGVVNGIPYSAAASSLIQRNDTSYIITRYNEDQNYINPKPDISFTTVSNITATGGTSWPEIEKYAFIKSIKTILNKKEIIITGTKTRSNQVLLLFFNAKTGSLETSRYFGSTYPVNLASVIPTSEGGLVILTQTFVAGRFPRIQLYKIPPEKLEF